MLSSSVSRSMSALTSGGSWKRKNPPDREWYMVTVVTWVQSKFPQSIQSLKSTELKSRNDLDQTALVWVRSVQWSQLRGRATPFSADRHQWLPERRTCFSTMQCALCRSIVDGRRRTRTLVRCRGSAMILTEFVIAHTQSSPQSEYKYSCRSRNFHFINAMNKISRYFAQKCPSWSFVVAAVDRAKKRPQIHHGIATEYKANNPLQFQKTRKIRLRMMNHPQPFQTVQQNLSHKSKSQLLQNDFGTKPITISEMGSNPSWCGNTRNSCPAI